MASVRPLTGAAEIRVRGRTSTLTQRSTVSFDCK
jgi:hypothetical protein